MKWVTFLLVGLLFALAACTPEPTASDAPEVTEAVAVPTDTTAPSATPEPLSVEPTATQPPMASVDDEQFDQSLAQAIESMDMAALRSLMRDRFLIADWQASLIEYDSEEVLQRFQESILAPGAQPAVRFETDIPALLPGTDPLSLWGPVANPVRALHVNGLGADAAQEAVLVIARDEVNDELFLLGILLPRAGKFSTLLHDPSQVAETDVTHVMANAELNVRIGPGTDYASVGLMRSGEIAQVTGVSLDGAWWRIFCTNDPSGICWITADPALSEPTAAP
jgi:hypothetical protein